MTLKARAASLEAELARLIGLRDRGLAAAKQADLSAVRVEAQLALVRELMAPKGKRGNQ